MIKLRLSFVCFNGTLRVCYIYMRVKLSLKTLIFSACLLSHASILAQETDPVIDADSVEAMEKPPKISDIERSVMPATQWLEKKLQNRPLIQPSIYLDDDKNEDNATQLTLREAIEKAKQQQPGTILSAKKIINEQSRLFEIKILSGSGIIKIIEIKDEKGIDEQ